NITAGTATVTLKQTTNATTSYVVSTGGHTNSKLELSDTELDHITASTINIGDINSGTLTIKSAITSNTNLALTSGSSIAADSAGTISTTGATVTLNTPGAIGTSANRIQFADNSNTAQQNVIIGSTNQASNVFLDGLGSLTLGNISGGTANTTIDVTARTNLVVAAGSTIDSGTSSDSLGADLTAAGAGDDGVGTLTLNASANVYGANISIRGADEDIDSTANVGNTGSSTVTTLASGTGLNYGSAFYNGNLYVTDQNNGQVLKITPGGATSVYATGFSSPRGCAFDSAGNMYVTNFASTTISKVAPGGGAGATFASGFSAPWGITVDASDNIYVADTSTARISKVTVSSPGVFSSVNHSFSSPGAGLDRVHFAPDGTLYASGFFGVSKINTTTGAATTFVPLSSTRYIDLAFDAGTGLIYAVDATSSVLTIDASGTVSTYVTGNGLSQPDTISRDSSGNLYVGNVNTTSVLKLVPAAGTTTQLTVRSSVESRPMSLGAGSAVSGVNLSAAELARLQTASTGSITIGDSLQTGNITITTATPATTAGASLFVKQSTAGAGKIVLDDNSGGGTALNGNGGTISLTAGTGGITAASTNNTVAEISTAGASVTLNTTGSIGTSTNRIQFADNTNSAQQNVIIGSGSQASNIFLDGLGSLTLGNITGNTANSNFDVTARTNLVIASGAALTTGTGTASLGADLNADATGNDGIGTLTVTNTASVTSANTTSSAITLRGADIDLTAASGTNVSATGTGGGVVVRSSQSSRPMSLGGGSAVSGINLTDTELTRITALASGAVTFGDSSQTGNITLTTATLATTAGTATIITQSTAGSGQIILDDAAGAGSALNGNSGNVTLNSGSGGISEAGTNTAGTADIGSAGITSLTSAGPVGTSSLPLQFGAMTLNTDSSTNNSNQFLKGIGAVTIGAPGLNAGTGTVELDGGTFTLGGANRINDNTKLNVKGSTFDISTSNETVNTVTLTSGNINGTSGVLTSTNTIQAQSGSIGAILAGGNGLTKSTSGTVTLSGVDTYTNSTTISGGTLVVSGSLAAGSAVAVNNTGNLAGTGTINGSVTVNTGGLIVPGTDGTVGTITVGSLIFNGGTYKADILNNTSDTIVTSGTINLTTPSSATFTLGTVSGTTSMSNIFALINNTATGNALTNTPFIGATEGSSTTVNGLSAAYSYLGGPGGNDFDLSVAGPYTFTMPVDSAATAAVLKRNGTNLDFTVGGTTLQSVPLAAIASLTITGENGFADQLTLDFTGGDFATLFPITFNGGSGAGIDTLVTVGGSFTTLTSNFTNANDGSILLANGSGTRTINYTGLEPITIGGTVTDTIINLPAAASNAVLEDDGTASNGIIRLRSSNATFETTDFPTPSGSLTVNRGNASDTLSVTVPTTDYNATLTVGTSSNPLSSLTFSAAQNLTVGGGNLTAFAGTMAFNSAFTATGTVDLTNGAGGTSQTGALTVPSLVLRGTGVDLFTNSGNNITTLAVSTSANVSYRDTDGFALGTVAGVVGINVGANNITLQSGGAVTQSQKITASGLELLGAGPYTLTDTGNDVTTLAGNVTGAVSYLDKNDLAIGTVNTIGLTTTNATITVQTNNSGGGSTGLTVSNAVNAGAAAVALSVNLPAPTLPITNNSSITGNAVTLTANKMILAGGTIVATSSGRVVLKPTSNAWGIDLGSTTDASASNLELSDSEIDTITTAGVLEIRSTTTGNITVTAAITPAASSTLRLTSPSGSISEGGSGSLQVANLAATASGSVSINNPANNVTKFAASGTAMTLVETDGFDVDTVDGVNGVSGTTVSLKSGGPITVQNTSATNDINASDAISINLTGNDSLFTIAASAKVLTTTNGVIVAADQMALTGTLNAAGQTVQLMNSVGADPIDLGGADASGKLALSDTELDNITAATLQIGSATDGAISITSAGVGPNNVTGALSLITGSGVTETGTLTYANGLRISAVGTVNLPGANNVGTLAAAVSGAGNGFSYNDADNVTVGSVDGVNGVTTSNGAIAISTTSGSINVTDTASAIEISAGTSTISLTAGGSGSTSAINVPASFTGKAIAATGGITLIANNMNLSQTATTSLLVDAGTGTVSIHPNSAGIQVNVGGAGTSDTSTILDINSLELININGSLNFSNLTGDFHILGKLSPTGGNTVTIQTTQRIIDDHNGSGDATDSDIVAANVVLVGSLGVGISGGTATDQEIETAASNLESSGGTGGVAIANIGNLVIGGISGVVGVSASGGDINVSAVGGITVNELVSNTGGGNVNLTTNNSNSGTGSNYQLITGAFSATSARTDAASRGGWVATIRSAAENALVYAAAGGNVIWIGAEDVSFGGAVWEWDQGPDAGVQFWSGINRGSQVGGEYSNWNPPSEPNNQAGSEYYVMMYDTMPTWNDKKGNTNLDYVLETSVPLGANSTDDLVLNANVTSAGGNGNITLNGADDILQNGGTVSAAGAGAVNYHASTAAPDGVLTMASGTQASSSTGAISMDAQSNISLQLVTTAGSVAVTSATGNVTANNTGATDDVSGGTGVTFNLQANDTLFTLASGANVNNTTSGGVTVSSDKMNLAGTISAAGQTVTLQTGNAGASTDAINLGSATDSAGNTLELSDAELDGISANKLVIGTGTAGTITISSNIDLTDTPTIPTLRLNTNSNVDGTAGGISVGSLAVSATGSINLSNATNNVTKVAASGTAFTLVETNGFDVDTVDGINGISGTTVSLTSGGPVTVQNTSAANDINATDAVLINLTANDSLFTIAASAKVLTTTNGVTISADQMALTGTLSAVGQTVLLKNSVGADSIDLGGADASGKLALSDTELDNLTAAILQIGSATEGAISITAAGLGPNNVTGALSLVTGAGVTETGTVTFANGLRISAVGAITLAGANNVGTLSAAVSGAGNAISYNDADNVAIGSLDGVNGVSTSNGTIAITTTSGAINIADTASAAEINAGTSTISLTAGGSGSTSAINSPATFTGKAIAASGGITLIANNMNLSQTGSAPLLVDAGSGTVSIHPNTAGLQVNVGGAGTTDTSTILDINAQELSNINGSLNFSTLTSDFHIVGKISPTGGNTVTIQTTQRIIDDHNGSADDTDSDIVAANVVLSGGAGVGVSGGTATDQEIETTASNLESNGGTGGVAIANIGNLTIGGISSVVGVSATGGNISVTSVGGITVNEPVSDTGGGQVTLTVQNSNSSGPSSYTLISGSFTAVAARADALSRGGWVATITSSAEDTLVQTAAGSSDVWIGASDNATEGKWIWDQGPDTGLQFWTGNQGGSVIPGNFSRWQSGEPNGGTSENYAELYHSSGNWNDLSGGGGLPYVLETGGIAAATDDLTLNADVTTTGGTGAITLNGADDILQNSGTVSAAGSGAVNYNASTAATNGLLTMSSGTQATTGTGTVTMTAKSNVSLQLVTTGGSVSVTSANGNVTVNNTAAATDISAGTGVTFNLQGNDTLFTLASGANITNTTSGGVTISADKMNLAGTITATSQTVTLQTGNAGGSNDAINLGSATDAVANTLELSDTELGQITASKLVIGSTTAGSITFSTDINLTDAPIIPTLHLNSGSSVTGTAGGIVVGDIAINAAGAVNFTDSTTNVNNLAISDTTGNITFTEANGLNVTAVDGLNGVSTSNGGVTLNVTTGNLSVLNTGAANDINATNAIVLNLLADEALFTIAASAIVGTSSNGVKVSSDKMNLIGAITAAGQTATLQTGNNGTSTDAVNLGSATDAATNTLELSDTELGQITASKLVIGTGTAGAITVSSDIDLTNAPVIGTLRLNTGSTVTGTAGGLVVGDLAIGAAGAVNITDSTTNVTNLAVTTTTGNVTFTEANGLNVSTVDGLNGVSTGSGSVTLNVTAGDLLVNNTAAANDISATTGILLTLSGNDAVFTVNTTANVQTTGNNLANDITVNADEMVLNGTVTASGSNQIVTLRNNTANKQIILGTNPGTAGILELDSTELSHVSAGKVLRIGRNDAAATGNVDFTGSITAPAGWSTLHLLTGAAVLDDNAAVPDVTVANLAIDSVTGIGASGSDAPDLDVLLTNLAFNNTTSGSVSFNEAALGGGIVVNSVDGIATSNNSGTTTHITAHSPVTFAVNTTSVGTITADAVESSTPSFDNVTVNSGVTVDSTGGNVLFNAGDQIIVTNTATVKSDTGNVVLASGVADTDGDDSQTLNGTIQANNSATTQVTIDLRANGGIATEASTGSILAGRLQLLSTISGGSFSLATSLTNNVATIAAATDGSIAYRDVDNLIVGTASTAGITTTSDDVQLITGGTIQINNSINLVAGNLGLQAGGAVTQGAGDNITANGLALTNVGPFTLTNSGNNIAILAANSANTVDYVDADSFIVGAVTVLGSTTTGIATSNDDVRLTATAGGITISNTINLSNGGTGGAGGSLDLLASTGATQAGGANILANSLLLRGTGALIGSNFFNLPNTTNNVATIAANLTDGALTYEDADALTVGIASVTTVAGTTSATGIAVGNPASVAPAGGDVFLRAGQVAPQTGILSVTQPITTTSGTLGNLTIGGGVQFSGSGSTSVGSGDIDLAGGPLNEDIWITVPTTHTMTGGTVTYKPKRDIIIDAPVTVVNGNFVMDADGEGAASATTIAQTSANLGAGNGDGGVWIRSDGSAPEGAIDVQSGVNGGGSLVIAGSQIHNTPFGGSALTGLVANTGVQIDNNTGVANDVNADTLISILVKTAGGAGNDLLLNGNVHSDGSGPINVQVEDTLTQNGTVQLASAGTITYDAEDMIINTSSADIDAQSTGIVWLRNRTAGRQIDVGTDTAGELGITDAELDRIATASVIRIGRRDAQASGDVTVSTGPITPANNNTLHLISGANLLETAGYVVVTNLALEASDTITFATGSSDSTANDNNVANLAMANYNAGADATYISRTVFNVGTVDGVVGINVQDVTTLDSGIEAALAGDVVQSSPITSNSLQLLGQGNYTFDLASNDINTLAANVLNSVIYDDANTVTVGTVTSGLGTTIGTSSSSITLTAPTVIVNNAIVTTSELGFVILDVTTLLDVNGTIGGGVTVDPIINSKGFVQQTGTGSVQLQGKIVTTDDNVSFNGPVKIGTTAGTTALIDTGSTGGGNITFNSTVQGTTASATPTFENLTLNAGTGDILFNNQVGGGGLRLGVVSIQTARNVTTNVGFTAREINQLTGAGETKFNGFVQTNQANGINLTSNYITFNGSIQTTNGGTVTINNASDFQLVAGTGAINSDGAVKQTGAGLNMIGGDIATTDDVISFATNTYISNTSVLLNAGLGDVSFAKLLQINNKTLTIRDGNSVDLGTQTTIANGVLNVYVGNSPSLTEGTVNLVSGAVFTGAGTVNANLNVGAGATLAPASATTLVGTGILTVAGNVNMASGSVLAVDLNSAVVGTGYDQIVITGAGNTMNITSGAVLQASRNGSFTPAVGTTLRIVDGVNSVVGTFLGTIDGTPLYLNGAYFTINYNNSTGDITLTGANPPGGAAKIIDNDEAAASQYSATSNNGTLTFSPASSWSLNTVTGRGFTNDLRFAAGAASQTATAAYTFNGLTPGTTYRISTTWFELSNRATNAPFTITGGASSPTVLVNQQKAPVGFTSNGATWQDLSTGYTVTGTSLTITLGNKANGYVIADAIRIEAVTSAGPLTQVIDTTDSNTSITNGSGSINFGTATQGGMGISKVITITNGGSTPLILGSATLTAPAGFQITGYTPTTLAAGATSTPITITLLATTAGNYSGTISFQTNDSNANPFTFNVLGSVVSTSVWIVDNKPNTGSDLVIGPSPVIGAYSETGTWFNNTDPNVGYLQDLRFASASSTATATWSFTVVPSGTYRISVAYRAESNRATNASFTVTDGTTPVSVNVNEQNQPDSFQSATVYWKDLVAAYGSVSSGTITVTLNAAGSNGYVIADAVRIERVAPLMAAAGPAPQPVTTVLTQSDLSFISAAAITRWEQAGLNSTQIAALNSVQIQIQDLPGGQLSGETQATIFIDPTAAGYGWYIDPTPLDDSEFGTTVTATEKTSTTPNAATHMDLLTIVMHELGLRLGLQDLPVGTNPHVLMTDEINVGTRRLPPANWQQATGTTGGTTTGGTTTGGTTTGGTTTGGTTTPPLTPAQIKAAAKAAAAKAAAEKAAAAKAAAAQAAAEKAAAKAAAAKLAAEKAAAAKAAAAAAAAAKAAAKAAAAAAAKGKNGH
ncbi:MAG: Extracellular serine protease precursor, partial [Planctomycetaceae bacterium]|nr:Extracellular serine protease precursor [Planctomycetaceae bacterium]